MWGIVGILAVANTALAYVVYYGSLRVMTAIEMNVFLNLTPLFTAIVAWLVFAERLGAVQIIGMGVAIAGVILVQLGKKEAQAVAPHPVEP